MGFHRELQPSPPPVVIRIDQAVEDQLQALLAQHLPLHEVREPAEGDCANPDGHDFIASCSDIVCVHCGRIVWR